MIIDREASISARDRFTIYGKKPFYYLSRVTGHG